MKKVIILTEAEVCKAITDFIIKETKSKASSISCIYDVKQDVSLSEGSTVDSISVEMTGA